MSDAAEEAAKGADQTIARLEAELEQLRGELAQTRNERDFMMTHFGPWFNRGLPGYDHDCLAVWNKDISFLEEPRFARAYQRGMASGHRLGGPDAGAVDIHIEWRVLTCCWAAAHAAHLPGDFVECGVNTGIMSLAVCDYVDFNRLDKDFYLFDTFEGIPVSQISERERETDREVENTVYPACWEIAQRNFAPFPRAHLIRGVVPDTLAQAPIDAISYFSVDMNITYPERAALAYFWDKITPGGVVLFDDYGWSKYAEQKEAHDAFARSKGVEILNLPTGQGLLIKPPHA